MWLMEKSSKREELVWNELSGLKVWKEASKVLHFRKVEDDIAMLMDEQNVAELTLEANASCSIDLTRPLHAFC